MIGPAAPARSRRACQRIAASPSRSHWITLAVITTQCRTLTSWLHRGRNRQDHPDISPKVAAAVDQLVGGDGDPRGGLCGGLHGAASLMKVLHHEWLSHQPLGLAIQTLRPYAAVAI